MAKSSTVMSDWISATATNPSNPHSFVASSKIVRNGPKIIQFSIDSGECTLVKIEGSRNVVTIVKT